jgi:hypothetical protein
MSTTSPCSAGQTLLWSSTSNPPSCGTPTYSTWFPAYISGSWYLPPFSTGNSGVSLGSGRIYCAPFPILQSVTVKNLFARVSTAGSSGAVFELAIFTNSNGRPGTNLGNTGSLSGTATGQLVGSVTPFTMNPGVYWACAQKTETTDFTLAFTAYNASIMTEMSAYIGSTSSNGTNLANPPAGSLDIWGTPSGWSFGNWTLPTTWNEETTAHAPIIGFQVN